MSNKVDSSLKILFIHHCGIFGGASRSLLELITAFPNGQVKPVIITQKGKTSTYFRKLNLEVYDTIGLSQFDNTRYGYYRHYRWLILFREILYLPFTFFILIKVRRKHKDINLIHLNDYTYLPLFVLCYLIFHKPIVIHARSIQRESSFKRSIFIEKIYRKLEVAAVICIDDNVKSKISSNLPLFTIHNGFKKDSVISNIDLSQDDVKLYKSNSLIVGFIGNLLYLKGSKEFVEAANICKIHNLDVKFIIVGYGSDNNKVTLINKILKLFGIYQNSTEDILNYIKENNLENIIQLFSFTTNISKYYNYIDILCFPSHLNATGRPVFEAAFHKKPSIVAVKNPTSDTIIDSVTGICIQEKNPTAIVDAIKLFYYNRELINIMGEEAYKLAMNNYDIVKNAQSVLNLYKKILEDKQCLKEKQF